MSDFQNLLMQISTEYINAPVSKINQLINQSLAEIADFSSADRAYVFRYDYEKKYARLHTNGLVKAYLLKLMS